MKNYHTHTWRCKHAFGNEEDYVKCAIQAGYTELGFSDHTPWHYHTNFQPYMRMNENELDDYVQTLLMLKEKYKNQISIKIGLEVEYFKDYIPWLKQVLQDYPIDYLILGNHYDETDEYGVYFGQPLNAKQFQKYVDSCIAGIKTGLFSYLAHPDLANYPTDSLLYKQAMRKLCEAAKDYGVPLEFNLLGLETHRQYPNETFFKIAKEVGNQVIIGVDAHEQHALLHIELYEQAKIYLNQLGIEVIEDIRFFDEKTCFD